MCDAVVVFVCVLCVYVLPLSSFSHCDNALVLKYPLRRSIVTLASTAAIFVRYPVFQFLVLSLVCLSSYFRHYVAFYVFPVLSALRLRCFCLPPFSLVYSRRKRDHTGLLGIFSPCICLQSDISACLSSSFLPCFLSQASVATLSFLAIVRSALSLLADPVSYVHEICEHRFPEVRFKKHVGKLFDTESVPERSNVSKSRYMGR